MGILKKIGEALRKTREAFRRKLDALLSKGQLDDDFYDGLEELLISCDVGVEATMDIVEELRHEARTKKLRKAEEVKNALKNILINVLEDTNTFQLDFPAIVEVVGVNGVGKTTSIGKLTHYFKKQGKSVLLIAGDTFRAAASAQLTQWADRNKVKIVKHQEGADAGAVVFDGIQSAKAKNTDVAIIDTAGRLHTKTNLMEELKKINKAIAREADNMCVRTFIVIDATVGQNAMQMVQAFNDYVKIDGIILTKLDGTAKGGIVIALAKELSIPVCFLGVGEGLEDLEPFDATAFVDNLF